MTTDSRPPTGRDGHEVQRFTLGEDAWVHLPEPTPQAAADLTVGTPIPAAVRDALGAPPDRPQRTVAPGWTTWTLRPVGFRIDPAVVDAGHLVLAVGNGVVVTAGQLTDATAQMLVDEEPVSGATSKPAGNGIAATILGAMLEDVGHVVARLDDEVENIETAVFAPGRSSHAERIYRLKREVQTVRRCIGPLPELFDADRTDRAEVATDDEPAGAAQLPARARHLVEQLVHVDELLDGVLTAHLARVAIQQNDDMRRISAWVAIVAAPTAIASIYGMNFRSMPELDWPLGYPLVLLTMLVVCAGLHRLFRRSGWL